MKLNREKRRGLAACAKLGSRRLVRQGGIFKTVFDIRKRRYFRRVRRRSIFAGAICYIDLDLLIYLGAAKIFGIDENKFISSLIG